MRSLQTASSGVAAKQVAPPILAAPEDPMKRSMVPVVGTLPRVSPGLATLRRIGPTASRILPATSTLRT